MAPAVNYDIQSELTFIENLGKHSDPGLMKMTRLELLMRYHVTLRKRYFNFCQLRIRLPMETIRLLEAAVVHELMALGYHEDWMVRQ